MPQKDISHRPTSEVRFWALVRRLDERGREYLISSSRERKTLMVDGVTYSLGQSDLEDDEVMERFGVAIFGRDHLPLPTSKVQAATGTAGRLPDSGFRHWMFYIGH